METTFYSAVHVAMWRSEQWNSAFGQIVSQHTQPGRTWSLPGMHIFVWVHCAPRRVCIHILHFHSEVPNLYFYIFFFLLYSNADNGYRNCTDKSQKLLLSLCLHRESHCKAIFLLCIVLCYLCLFLTVISFSVSLIKNSDFQTAT